MTPVCRRVLRVSLERRFFQAGGCVYTEGPYGYEYWRDFLTVFDAVEPVARVTPAEQAEEHWVRADGPGVRFQPIQHYLGFWQFVRRPLRVYRDCAAALHEPSPVLLRMGVVSLMCWLYLKARGRPYAFEGMGHAGLGAARVRNVRHLGLGRLIGLLSHSLTRRCARGARCAAYASRYVQRLYPTRSRRHEWIFDCLELPPEAFLPPRREDDFASNPLRIITVGRLEPEKGHATLIRAVARLAARGRSVRCDIVGDGREMARLHGLARELNVSERVVFHGHVRFGAGVRELLKQADLFVLPSLTEGLGRALVEAMAAALPAIGSRAGGIPELLGEEALVPPDDPDALADAIDRIGWNPTALARLSRANCERAREFRPEELNRVRREFWTCIKRQFQEYERRASRA